jgi:hypothetical protein
MLIFYIALRNLFLYWYGCPGLREPEYSLPLRKTQRLHTLDTRVSSAESANLEQ